MASHLFGGTLLTLGAPDRAVRERPWPPGKLDEFFAHAFAHPHTSDPECPVSPYAPKREGAGPPRFKDF